MATAKKREVFLLKNKVVDGVCCGPDYEKKTATVDAHLADWWCENGTACDPKSAEAKEAGAGRKSAKSASVKNQDPNAENRDPK